MHSSSIVLFMCGIEFPFTVRPPNAEALQNEGIIHPSRPVCIPEGLWSCGQQLRRAGLDVLAQPGLLNVRIAGGIQTFHLIVVESDVERRHIFEKLFGPAAGDDG